MENEKTNDYLMALLNGMELNLGPPTQALGAKAKVVDKRFELEKGVVPLASIISALRKNEPSKDWHYSMAKLFLEKAKNKEKIFETVFPKLEGTPSLDPRFKEEWNQVKNLESKERDYTAYFLAQAYASRIAYEGLDQDASVFDYNRLLAGLTQIKTENYLLIKGAISGIQEFIYKGIEKRREIAGGTKRLSKQLRGRSFYVALLTDFISEMLVEKLELKMANIIFSGGGNFLILAPDVDDQQLKNFRKKINEMIFRKLGPKVSLVMAWEKCGNDVFENSPSYYEEVEFKLNESKKQKHLEYLETFFDLSDDIEIDKRTQVPKANSEELEEVNEDERLGRLLPNQGKEYLIQVKYKEELPKGGDFSMKIGSGYDKFVVAFEEFNTLIFLGEDSNNSVAILDKIKKIKKFGVVDEVKIIRINDTDFLGIHDKTEQLQLRIAYGFRFIGKYAPAKEDYPRHVMPFENLVELRYGEDPRPSKERQSPLAVMRLDIDDLGYLFSQGLDEKPSFARLAALSREIHFFFAGYLNVLAEEYQIYVTYSGGDDAFVVGSWYNVLLFAKALQQDFAKFACDNEHVHFSAGILTCNVHNPVARFADDAGELLDDEAKEYEKDGVRVKNAIHVFNRTYGWKRFGEMLAFGFDLTAQTNLGIKFDKKKFNRSLVHRLLKIIQSKRMGDAEFYKNVALLHYLFAKHGFTKKTNYENQHSTATKTVQKILQEFKEPKVIEDYLLPTQFVLLKTRE